MPTPQTAAPALVLLLQTVPSGSAHIRVVHAQAAPTASPMTTSAPMSRIASVR